MVGKARCLLRAYGGIPLFVYVNQPEEPVGNEGFHWRTRANWLKAEHKSSTEVSSQFFPRPYYRLDAGSQTQTPGVSIVSRESSSALLLEHLVRQSVTPLRNVRHDRGTL